MSASMAEGIAGVLSAHWEHYCGLEKCKCQCGEVVGQYGEGEDMKAHAAHQAEQLAANGYGKLEACTRAHSIKAPIEGHYWPGELDPEQNRMGWYPSERRPE